MMATAARQIGKPELATLLRRLCVDA